MKGSIPNFRRRSRTCRVLRPISCAICRSVVLPSNSSSSAVQGRSEKCGILRNWRRLVVATVVRPSRRATSLSMSVPRSASSSGDQGRESPTPMNRGIPSCERLVTMAWTVRPDFRTNSASGHLPNNRSSLDVHCLAAIPVILTFISQQFKIGLEGCRRLGKNRRTYLFGRIGCRTKTF